MDQKAALHRYLQRGREALVWKLDGLSDYDIRRPLVRTGTNLLGLVKHVAVTEAEYFGLVFDRPFDPPVRITGEENPDKWAFGDEAREQIVDAYRQTWAHSDATISELALDAPGRVPWWPDDINPVTLHWILVHMIAETDRHAGHADIIRELIDGAAGMRKDGSNMPDADEAWWEDYRAKLEREAQKTR